MWPYCGVKMNKMADVVNQAKDEILRLRAVNADLLEALDEIKCLEPGNIDMAYEIANEAIRKAEEQS